MPVNPLTGDIIGNPGQKAPETPKKEYNPGMYVMLDRIEFTHFLNFFVFRQHSPRWKVNSNMVIGDGIKI